MFQLDVCQTFNMIEWYKVHLQKWALFLVKRCNFHVKFYNQSPVELCVYNNFNLTNALFDIWWSDALSVNFVSVSQYLETIYQKKNPSRGSAWPLLKFINSFCGLFVRSIRTVKQIKFIRYPFIIFSMAHSSVNVIMFANVRQLAFWGPHQDLRYFD